jgi:hypothetical protein
MGSKLIAIDPGVQKCGVAAFDDGKLVRANWIPGHSLWAVFLKADWNAALAIERMQVYKVSKGDPNDLILVSEMVGYLTAGFTVTSFYKPRTWKGQVPKTVIQKRVSKALDEAEFKVLMPWFNNHNVVDAVGIGLFHLGRIGK